MDSVVTPRPDRVLFFVDSIASLLRMLMVFCLCLTTATAALARAALRTFSYQALVD